MCLVVVRRHRLRPSLWIRTVRPFPFHGLVFFALVEMHLLVTGQWSLEAALAHPFVESGRRLPCHYWKEMPHWAVLFQARALGPSIHPPTCRHSLHQRLLHQGLAPKEQRP